MAALDAMVVTTALGSIRSDLGASIEALEWIVNAYTLTFAVLLLTGALLCDRFGRRRAFAAGIGLFVAASAACALIARPAIGGRFQRVSLGYGSSGSTSPSVLSPYPLS